MLVLDIKSNREIRQGFTGDNRNTVSYPKPDYSQIIPPIKDEEYIKFQFNYDIRAYFSNRDSDDEQFSTSFIFAGITETDKSNSSMALRNSFFIIDFYYGDNKERAGYYFSKIYPSNVVFGFDEDFVLKGYCLLKKKYFDSGLLNMDMSLRFFNGRRGSVSYFTTTNGSTIYQAKVSYPARTITSPQSNLYFFESWNPALEQLEQIPSISMPQAPDAPNNGVILPNGQVIRERVLVCGENFDIENYC